MYRKSTSLQTVRINSGSGGARLAETTRSAGLPMASFLAWALAAFLMTACTSPVFRPPAASIHTPENVSNGGDTSLGEHPRDSTRSLAQPENGPRGMGSRIRFNAAPMGWSSWNRYGGEVDQNLIKAIADAMSSNGMKDAGYQYVNIDDGWMKGRDAQGNIQADPRKFPDGMKALADYIHAKGLKLGIYLANYTVTCIGRGGGGVLYAGSLGHEAQDVRTVTSWGVDLIKFDDCDGTARSFDEIRMALDSFARVSGKTVYLDVPYVTRLDQFIHTPDSWAAMDIGDSARIASDVRANWDSIRHNIDVARVLSSAYVEPGFVIDMDSLEIGNGSLTPAEARTHMSIWAMMSAPLIAGNDLTLDNGALGLLTNREVIAIDQDSLHFAASEIALRPGPQGDIHVLAKPLSRAGSRAVALLNEGNVEARIKVKFADLGLAKSPASVRDVWAHKDLGVFSSSYEATVAPHGTTLLVIQGKEPALSGSVPLDALHWAYAAFNRIDTSPYTSNIAVDAAPPPSRATVYSPPVSTDAVIAADLLAPPVSGPLKIAGTTYEKGFGILGAPAQIAYRLDKHCSKFTAQVGVDDSSAVPGAVTFQVWGDSELLFDSGIMQQGLPARSVSVDVGNVGMLRLIALGRTGGQIQNQTGRSGGQSAFDTADWASPRLLCR
ncbi:NPCBM/NEW2 domain-containing protein [Trinickia sp. EG282A]|uniref:NPCBM/NEW2 domain-containing protein n=1 Tax=Trinickia sp. EG282A TaxID=3237013 RepID=UPI0034D36E45